MAAYGGWPRSVSTSLTYRRGPLAGGIRWRPLPLFVSAQRVEGRVLRRARAASPAWIVCTSPSLRG
jgi:hypothetical protein